MGEIYADKKSLPLRIYTTRFDIYFNFVLLY